LLNVLYKNTINTNKQNIKKTRVDTILMNIVYILLQLQLLQLQYNYQIVLSSIAIKPPRANNSMLPLISLLLKLLLLCTLKVSSSSTSSSFLSLFSSPLLLLFLFLLS